MWRWIFSTNSDFTFAGGDFFGAGPIAAAKTSVALNYGAVKSFTTTIWFKPNDSTTWTGSNVGPRIFILGTNGVTDKNAVNSIGLYYQAANEISFNFNGNEVDPTAGATGPDYTLGQWYFYAVTYDGTTVTGYQGTDGGDGSTGVTKVSSGSLPGLTLNLGSGTSPGSTLQIANRSLDQARSFDGWLSDFRFYASTAVTTAATAAQIEDIRWSDLAPTGLLVTIGNNQNILTWNSVTGASSYVVYRSSSLWRTLRANQRRFPVTANYSTPTPPRRWELCYYEVAAIDGGGDLTTGARTQPVINVQTGPSTVLTNLPATGIAATFGDLERAVPLRQRQRSDRHRCIMAPLTAGPTRPTGPAV